MVDLQGPRRTTSLRARRSELSSPSLQLARLAQAAPAADFEATLAKAGLSLTADAPSILQLNLGKLCNMACRHCHVDAGPDRTDEQMTEATASACLELLDRLPSVTTVDLTGGAPELNPVFRPLVQAVTARGRQVIDRCNLTILLTGPGSDLPAFFAEHGVEVVASLPHWRRPNTDAQRGDGTFERSLEALRRLNAVGYGQGDPRRRLTLMHNPAGAFLPGNQASLEREWRAGLERTAGVSFDRLICLNNMPISRYLEWLEASGNLEAYLSTLVQAFNPAAVEGLMCRNTLSVGWDGRLFDCDFNQMLDLPADLTSPRVEVATEATLKGRKVVTKRHCFGCTAGAGSSCGGATALVT